jgi:hypothetical protein
MGWTNFAPVAMETKKGGFKKRLDSFELFQPPKAATLYGGYS